MKKITAIINDKSIYDVKALLGEIGVVKSVTGKTGLINVNTNEIVGTFDKYEDTKVDSNLFLQRKVVRGNNNKIITFLRIYDAKVQKMVADNGIFVGIMLWIIEFVFYKIRKQKNIIYSIVIDLRLFLRVLMKHLMIFN